MPRRSPAFLAAILLASGCTGRVDDLFFDGEFDTGFVRESAPCFPAEQLDALEAHLRSTDLLLTTGAVAAAPDNAVAWFGLAGLPRSDWFALPLDAACPDATPVEFCTGGLCYAVTCEGPDGDWRTEITLDADHPPGADILGEATLADAAVSLTYEAAAGTLAVELSTSALGWPDGSDWTAIGSAEAGVGTTLESDLLALHEWGPARIDLEDGAGSIYSEYGELAVYADGELGSSPTCF